MNKKLYETIAEVLNVPEDNVSAATSIENEARWDSLRHMNIIFALEDAFGVRFTDEEIPLLTSVEAIEKALAERA
jgi:acyl carrier protein